jgi:hypothetical protein
MKTNLHIVNYVTYGHVNFQCKNLCNIGLHKNDLI